MKKDQASEKLLELLGSTIRAKRESLNISQERLAEISGAHRTYISEIERGMRNPSIILLHEVANALGVSITDLISDWW